MLDRLFCDCSHPDENRLPKEVIKLIEQQKSEESSDYGSLALTSKHVLSAQKRSEIKLTRQHSESLDELLLGSNGGRGANSLGGSGE